MTNRSARTTKAAAQQRLLLNESMRVSELRYRRLFEAARDGIFLLDIDTLTITDANPFMTELLGYTLGEFVGKELWELGFFSDRSASKEAFRILQQDGYLRYEDLPLKTKGGKLREVEFVSNVYFEDETQVIQCNIRDITERKQLEKEQEETRERFHTLFEYAPDGILIASPESYYLEANASMCRMLGYTREELIGLHAENIVTASEVRHIEEALDEIASTVNHHRVWRFRRKDGSDFPGEVLVTEMPGGNLLAMIRDISDRERTDREKALLTSQIENQRTRLDNIVANVPGIVWETSGADPLVAEAKAFVSRYVENMLGYTVEEWLATPNFWLSIVHPDDRERVGKGAEAVVRTGQNLVDEFRWLTKDGRVIWVEVHSTPVLDNKGSVIGVRGVTIDITERRLAEEQLRDSEEKFSGAFAFAPIGVALVLPDGRWLKVNRALCELIGYSEAELLTRTFQDITHPEDLEDDLENMRRIIDGEIDFYQIENRYFHKLGHLVPISLSVSLVRDDQGNPRYFISQIQDITERKKAQDELQRQQTELRVLFDLMPAMIWFKDTENNILRVNQRVADAAGLLVGDIEGKPTLEIYPDQAAKFYADDRAVLTSRKPKLGEVELLSTTDGQKIWVQTDKVPYFDANGESIGIVVMAQDVTERKNAEHALVESDEKFHQLADNINDVFWIRSPDMSKVYYVSPAYSEIWGRPIEIDSMPKGWLDRIFPEDRQIVSDAYGDLMGDVAKIEVEYRILRPDGAHRWVRTRGFQVRDSDGTLIRLAGIVTDITERRRVSQALTESEARYRELFENAIDIIYTHDLQGNYTSVNKAGESIMGYTKAEALAMNIADTVAPEFSEKAMKMIAAKLAGEEVTAYELDLIAKGGHRITVEVNTRILYERDIPVGVQGIARDITKRKQTEAALRSSEASFKSLFDTANDAIMVLSEGSFLDCNHRAELLFGLAKDDIIGHSPMEFSPPVQPDGRTSSERAPLYLSVALDGIPQFFEWQHVRPDGTRFDAEVSLNRVDFGGSARLQAIVRDVTERKLAEAALAAAEENYRSIFENAVEGIFQSTQDGRFISANPAMARILGYDSPAELMADRVDIMNQHYVDPVSRVDLKKMLTDHDVAKGYECEVFRRDRSTIWTQENIRTVRNANGDILYYEGSLEDITARKSLEGQLRQSQKMEAVGVLAGGIAHDFNNLLTAINGYSSLTLKKMAPDHPFRHNIEEVKNAGDRAAELTSQLLAFSRKQVLQPVVINLNTVVSNIQKMLRRIIRESIELHVVLDPALSNVRADPGQIEQVIMNLTINARDAMPDGGTLTVETKNVFLDERYARQHGTVIAGEFVRMTVTDTGEGMAPATQLHIFEPFFTTKEVGKGTGLGLSTVYGIVKQSGGDVLVYSELGHGTTFKIYLPRVVDAVNRLSWATDEASSEGTETILLVEDEEIVRTFVKTILSENGYKVLEASNGAEALAIGRSHSEPIHMLLTDLIMPKMSGTDLKDQLFKIRPDIKNLFMSGYTDASISHQGVLQSGTAFIEKPFSPDALFLKIREVLDE